MTPSPKIINNQQTRDFGSFLGVVSRPDKVVSYDGDFIIAVDGQLYDCYPYLPTLKGYPIRYKVSCDRIDQLPKSVKALLGLEGT